MKYSYSYVRICANILMNNKKDIRGMSNLKSLLLLLIGFLIFIGSAVLSGVLLTRLGIDISLDTEGYPSSILGLIIFGLIFWICLFFTVSVVGTIKDHWEHKAK